MERLSDLLPKPSRDYTNTSVSDNKINNTNTSVATQTKKLSEIQAIAEKLEQVLGKQDQSRYPYYCKVAKELPENLIWNCLEAALKGHSPAKLFSYLTAQYTKKAPAG